jgi:drug/metabolite transporter (DMT)-like permease
MATIDGGLVQPAPRESAAGFGMTDLMLIGMATIWGVNYSVIKYGTRVFPPLVFNAVRIPLASAAQLGASRVVAQPRLPGADRMRLVLLGMLGNGVYQVFFILGLARTRVATAALVMAATPALIALFGWLHGSERLTSRAWAGIALQLAGMSCVVLGATGVAGGSDSFAGVLLVLLAAASWASYSILIRPFAHRVPVLQLGGYTMLGGAIEAVATGVWGMPTVEWSRLAPSTYLAIAYSGLVALVLAYLFWYRGVRAIGPTRTSMYGNLQPLIAMAVAWLVLSEQPTAWQLAGGACIMTGILLARAQVTPSPVAGTPD